MRRCCSFLRQHPSIVAAAAPSLVLDQVVNKLGVQRVGTVEAKQFAAEQVLENQLTLLVFSDFGWRHLTEQTGLCNHLVGTDKALLGDLDVQVHLLLFKSEFGVCQP